ncbi:hypothetical protein Z043_110630, partial [Scleropages formosus]
MCQEMSRLNWLSIEGIEIGNIQRRMFEPLKNLTHICKPNTDGISSFENLLANIVLRVFVWVVSATTCFGNLFVICMRSYIRSENKLHALCIISLCCADGLMGVYLFVIGAFDLKFRGEYNRHAQAWMDSVQCQVVGSLAMLSTEVSVLLLTYLTLEKYVCIVYPFRYLAPGRLRTVSILVAIWVLGFVIAFIPLKTGTRATEYSNHIKKEVTIAKRFFSIVITDSLCWIPIFILKILSLLQVEIPGTISSWVVIFILPINSALNPILYTLTTRPFKETILQVWNNYRQRKPRSNSQPGYTPSFTWLEMWPVQETNALSSPEYLAHPSEMSLTSGKSDLL